MKGFREIISNYFIPNRVVAFSSPYDKDALALLPPIQDKRPLNEKPTVYVCEGFTCKAPITELNDLPKALEAY